LTLLATAMLLTIGLARQADIDAARSFARARQGTVAFAVLEWKARRRRPRGLRRTQRFPSASVSKAMLLVAYLRSAGSHDLSDAERAVLRPMIVVSDNDAADAVYARVGASGLRAVAGAATGSCRSGTGGTRESCSPRSSVSSAGVSRPLPAATG
jgi:beta-lactamase class A